ncbi:beta-galactosidase [Arthrobacter sp. AFG7.2]|uniref:beta-galactosidase n=1 Tax=Arthrobacter sp. AFG7.2 TaxID=1688693 RepID=UPI000C9E732E|nr:beta-galactosidase [Arthrobacter sp. AFG7.2]PNI09058.1 beta-galactosidase [Arthrobacter sp. AFG7.2]
MPTHPPSPAALLRVTHQPWDSPATIPAMSNSVDRHNRYRLTNRYLEIGGKPALPVSGELHFSRVPRTRWEERLRLMKAGGITVVASYIFWIHHEPRESTASFEGNLDVAAFVRLCSDIGLDVVLRIGPWCHGEVRNGGFPDWVQSAPVKHRTNDPAYLELVRGWFGHLGEELAGLGGPGSNIIGIQLENELYDQPGHITELKGLARNAGLSAPIWTATAWGGADLPEGEVLPLFGGYGDGFWVDADAPWDPTFREHYFFSHVWDDPGIGADIREHLGNSPGAAAPRTPSALFPPATCELAGGMATAYQRRPWPRGLDVAAVAHNKIGNGSSWQGYYMFAGGSNPDDGLQESQATGYPNDLPRFDYDFHAPIGTSGRPAFSFAALRKQHAFLAAFGDRTAEMPSTLPQVMPAGIEDTSTLRWALRSNGNAGFVFITWHQPHVPLGTYEGAQFEVVLDAGPVTFPAVPVDIPAGTIAHWPVNLEACGVTLEWATASPLSLLAPAREIPGSRPTLVLTAENGIPVELRFAPGTKVFRPGHADLPAGTDESFRIPTDEPIVLTAQAGDAALDVLVLPADMGNNAWVLDTRRGRELVISQEPVWVDGQGRIAGRFRKQQEVRCYRPASRSFTALPVLVTGAAGDGHSQERDLRAELVRPAAPVPASFGSRANRAAAPQPNAIDELAQTYSLEIPAAAFATDHVELDIRWAGDVAQLLVDGRPVADRFWDGSPWLLEVSDAGIRRGSEVILQILPLSPDAKIGLPLEARLRREATAGDLIALDSVRLIPWTGWQEHPEA